jgi:hypothetical protein
MVQRYRPIAPSGYYWNAANCLVAYCGCVESSHAVLLTMGASAALRNGAPVVDGRVNVTFSVAVEEVPSV